MQPHLRSPTKVLATHVRNDGAGHKRHKAHQHHWGNDCAVCAAVHYWSGVKCWCIMSSLMWSVAEAAEMELSGLNIGSTDRVGRTYLGSS